MDTKPSTNVLLGLLFCKEAEPQLYELVLICVAETNPILVTVIFLYFVYITRLS